MMTAATEAPAEFVFEGLDLDRTPPCEIRYGMLGTGALITCGNPSVARIRITVPCCGSVAIRFICEDCLWLRRNRKAQWRCTACDRQGYPRWELI